MMTVRRLLLACAAALLLLGGAALPASAEPPAVPGDVGELVGAAFDPETEVLWLAGERADDGVLVGVDQDRRYSEISFKGELVSVQALAFHEGGIYVGDVGDPDRARESVAVYRLADTQPGRQNYRRFDFVFPEEPQNARAMMVSARGRIYLVTDGQTPGIYTTSREPSDDQVNRLTRVADAPAGVTDGVFLADGFTMALRTAEGIEVIDAFSWETQAIEILVGAGAGEVLAVLPDDELLVGTVEGLRQSPAPTANITTTIAPKTPSPTPSSTATAVPERGKAAPARIGTLVAVLLAVLVAAGAGLVTRYWPD